MKTKETTIRRRLTKLIMGGGFTIIMLACVLFTTYQILSLKNLLSESLQLHGEITGSGCVFSLSFDEEVDAQKVLKKLETLPTFEAAALYREDGSVFTSHTNVQTKSHLPLMHIPGSVDTEWSLSNLIIYKPIIHKGKTIGAVALQSNLDTFYATAYKNIGVVLAIMVLAMAAMSIVSRLINKQVSEPIGQLSKTMQLVAESKDYSIKAMSDNRDEIGKLTERFNHMLAQIQTRDSALTESEQRFRALVDQSVDEIYLFNQAGEITDANLLACNSLDYTKGELLEKTVSELEVDYPIENCKADWQKISTGEQVTRTGFHLRKDGSQFPVEIKMGTLTIDDEQMVMAISRDISDRLEAQARLQKSEENLRITLDSIGDAVIATDIEGSITQINPVAEFLTGWDAGDGIGTNLKDVLQIYESAGGPRIPTPIEKLHNNEEDIGFEGNAVLIAKDGAKRFVAGSGEPLLNGDNETIGVVIVFRDVSKQLELEQRIQQSHKMESVGELAGGIAHDFNNMMAGILGAAELIKVTTDLDDLTKEYIDLIIKTGRSAADLTAKLLAFSRKEEIHTTAFLIHPLITDTCLLLASSLDRNIVLEDNLEASHDAVVGDLSLIQNAILNLCFNARDAMPDGGTLRISTRDIVISEEDLRDKMFEVEAGTFIEIHVEDSGHGISKENLAKIFEPYFTTKDTGKGTGLGLAAVYGTINDHNGTMKVYSEPGMGTSFQCYLPVDKGTASTITTMTDDEPVNGTGTVLVIDDEDAVRVIAKGMLSQLGYSVLTAEDGEKGVAVYKENHQVIDLIILDMVMPNMNGAETFKLLKELNSDVRVIIASGFTRNADMNQLIKDGVLVYIKKPFSYLDFSQTVAGAINKS
ncbi:hypothetical protein BVY04_04165 [bacterium M21]|nr:hypothetical protein BVY04_04165 [bacterium M21]